MSTTGSRKLCRLTVHTRIEFLNETKLDVEARLLWWRSAMEAYWDNHGQGWLHRGCRVRFKFETRERGQAAEDGWHQVTIVPSGFLSWSEIGPQSSQAVWNVYVNQATVAHEVGHLMGLPTGCTGELGSPLLCDEYTLDANGHYDQNLHPQAHDPQCVMAQTWGDVAVVPPHVAEILEIVELSCPYCCRYRWMPTLRWWLRPSRGPARARPAPSRPPHRPGGPASVRAILDAIDPRRPMTLSRAAASLLELGEGIVDDLLREAERSTDLQRVSIAAALGGLGLDREAVRATLARMADSDNLAVRLHAAYGLAIRGVPSGREIIDGTLETHVPIAGHPPMRASDLAEAMRKALGHGG